MATWRFSGGTVLDSGTGTVTGTDALSFALRYDLALVRKGIGVSVVTTAPSMVHLDLKKAENVDAWARLAAARHRQTVTTDAAIQPPEPDDSPPEPGTIY